MASQSGSSRVRQAAIMDRQMAASQSGSSRVRQAAIMDVWVAVNGPCTSIPNSTLRTSEVSALTDLVRSAASCSRATTKTLVATRGFRVRGARGWPSGLRYPTRTHSFAAVSALALWGRLGVHA
jgi:hypothetical protein